MQRLSRVLTASITLSVLCFTGLHAQTPAAPPPAPAGVPAGAQATEGVTPPADYVLGPADVLSIVFWKEADMTADVVVRPDGKITLPVINELQAAGLTPEQLRVRVADAATKLQIFQAPNVMVRVKEINSRFVTIVGEVGKQGPVPLTGPMTVMQLIGIAGGVSEYANKKNIMIIRNENGRERSIKFNYSQVAKGENLRQNIELKPGDTVVVP